MIAGLSGVSDVEDDRSTFLDNIPVFQESIHIGGSSHDTDDDDEIESKGFFAKSISEHIDGEQVSLWERSRLRIVKFQFSWYEFIPHGQSEDRRYSGRLYRDALKRSLQLQSFMVSLS